jgi:hypothetical protein
VALAACKDSASRPAKAGPPTNAPHDSVAEWAGRIDSLADSAHAREFKFPKRSTEGGVGRIYRVADSAVRIDVDDFGEMGRHRERFYARGTLLRLAVKIAERYDQPMSGNVVKTNVDSTWFASDSAIQWRDSLGVVRVRPDSSLGAHGREVFAEYLWSGRMAGPASRPRE